MTKNLMHQDLLTQEEYYRSGHTGSDMNTNAEGYVEYNPEMNAYGGLEVSEYLDCHTRVCPCNFDCLGIEVADAVIRLVNELFVNGIPELQHGGKLCPVLFISSARTIGSYNELVRDVTTGKIIVIKFMKAEESANIDDIRVAQAPDPRWNVILEA